MSLTSDDRKSILCRIITFVTRKKKKNEAGNEAGKAAREVIHQGFFLSLLPLLINSVTLIRGFVGNGSLELEAVKLTKEMERLGYCNGEDNAGTDDALKGSSSSVKKECILFNVQKQTRCFLVRTREEEKKT